MEDKDKLVTLEDLGVAYSELKEDLNNKADVIVSDASGTIVSITDGAEGKIKQTVFEMNPVQDLHGYDYPWPAGGGKNLFNYANENIGMSNMGNTNGVFANTNTDERAYFNMQVRALNNGAIVETTAAQPISSVGRKSATITVSSTITHLVIIHNGSQRNLSVAYPFTAQGTFTVSFNVTGYDPTTVGGLSFKDVQIESGSSMTDYAPYSNICPITGYDSLNAYRTGHNVWDEQWELGQFNNATGQPISANDCIRSKNFIPVLPSTTYYTTYGNGYMQVFFYGADESFISQMGVGVTNLITTPSGCYKMKFRNASAYGTTYNHDISINYPSTDTEYHAYDGDTASYTFQQTVYDGVLTINEYGSGQIVVTKGKAVYDGSEDESWKTYNAYNGFYIINPSMRAGTDIQGALSNWLKRAAWGQTGFRLGSGNSYIYVIGITNTIAEVSDLESWRAYLSNTPLEIIIPLAEPVIIPLSKQEVLTLIEGQNYIWHDANGNTTVIYRVDTKTYVDGLVTESNDSMIAPVETGTTASQAYAVGKYFILNGQFCKAKTEIASGATFTLNTNYEVTTVADELYTALH